MYRNTELQCASTIIELKKHAMRKVGISYINALFSTNPAFFPPPVCFRNTTQLHHRLTSLFLRLLYTIFKMTFETFLFNACHCHIKVVSICFSVLSHNQTVTPLCRLINPLISFALAKKSTARCLS